MNHSKISPSDWLNFFFPIRCLLCDQITNQKNTLCFQCSSTLKYSGLEKNLVENDLVDLFKGRIPLYKGYYHFQNDAQGVAKKIIHEMKYTCNMNLVKIVANSISTKVKGEFNVDCILPVPLSPKKQKQRGFNQSERIASHVFGPDKIYQDLVRRVEHTESQTGFGKFKRWENMESAFEVNTDVIGRLSKDSKIVIVDDVVTTGSTVESIMVQLRNYSSDFQLSLFSLLKA